ncbi:MAG: hypothetical protein ACLQVI_24535 [Polyangiaceae bacterium]
MANYATKAPSRRCNEYTTAEGAAKLGLTARQLLSLATARGYAPTRVEEWVYGRRSGTRYFWSARILATMRRTKEYARSVARALKRRKQLDEIRAGWARAEEEEKQLQQVVVAEVQQLALDRLLQLALECLHSANRAAKHASHAHWRTTIYDAKDAFLSAMLRASLATVGTFVIELPSRRRVCRRCGHEWVGDTYCLACDDHTGVAVTEPHRWYLVDCGSGYRFHRPSIDDDLLAVAVPIERHDPTQEPRVVPAVRLGDRPLDLTAQLIVVRAAAERLAARSFPPARGTCVAATEAASNGDNAGAPTPPADLDGE